MLDKRRDRKNRGVTFEKVDCRNSSLLVVWYEQKWFFFIVNTLILQLLITLIIAPANNKGAVA